MKVLVINAGSSSLKYQVIDMATEEVLAIGNCERIGIDGSFVGHKTSAGVKLEEKIAFPTHKEAFEAVTRLLTSGEGKVLDSLNEIEAVGHRVVHGGEIYKESVLITPEVLKNIDELSSLAPLHNPAHVIAIKACQAVLDESVPHVAVFDTAFHQTMPEEAYIFGVPYEFYEKYGLRRYGMHGTSHRYVSMRCADLLGKDLKDTKIVTCHLGNGASITAVDGGKSVDTSMGLTPLGGIIMGTRSGDLDPSVVNFIAEKENLNTAEMDTLLNKKSGFLGISGFTSDARDLESAAKEGNHRAALAEEIQFYQVKKFIGAYAAAMGGLDAVVFTGGIGENSIIHREAILKDMEFLGIEFDAEKNNTRGGEVEISKDGSKTKAFIIQTNEELMIAQDTVRLSK